MIRLVVQSVFKPGTMEQALEIYTELVRLSREEDGCHQYVLARHTEDPDTLVLLEAWRDEQALAAHQQAPHFARLTPQLQAFRQVKRSEKYIDV